MVQFLSMEGEVRVPAQWAEYGEYLKDEIEKNKELVAVLVKKQNEAKINEELIGAQGKPQTIGGYYQPNPELTSKAMRPSGTFNAILAKIA